MSWFIENPEPKRIALYGILARASQNQIDKMFKAPAGKADVIKGDLLKAIKREITRRKKIEEKKALGGNHE